MNLFKVLTKKFVKDGTSQFQKFHVTFHKFHTLFSMRLSVRLGYHMTGSKNAHGCAQNTKNGFDFDFSEPIHKDGDELLNHIV
jgi:hypothetical protein